MANIIDRRHPQGTGHQRWFDLLGRLATLLAFIFVVYGFVVLQDAAEKSDRAARQAQALAVSARNQAKQVDEDRKAAVAANILARHDDCVSGNRIRRALRAQIRESNRTTPLLLKAVPNLDTPQVRALIKKNSAKALTVFADRDCHKYAVEALPHGG